jgi:hypothetical protein
MLSGNGKSDKSKAQYGLFTGKCCVEFERGRPLAWHSLDLFLMLLLYENGIDDRAQADLKKTIDLWLDCGLLGNA